MYPKFMYPKVQYVPTVHNVPKGYEVPLGKRMLPFKGFANALQPLELLALGGSRSLGLAPVPTPSWHLASLCHWPPLSLLGPSLPASTTPSPFRVAIAGLPFLMRRYPSS